VAEEIRKLSETSAMSVDNIYVLVQSFIDQIQRVMDVVHHNKDVVHKSVSYSKNIEHSLLRIDTCSNNVYKEIDDIINIVSEQQTHIELSNNKIENLSIVFNKLSQSIEGVYEAITEHTQNTKVLEAMNSALLNAASSLNEYNKKLRSDYTINRIEDLKKKSSYTIDTIKEKLLAAKDLTQNNYNTHKEILDDFIKNEPSIEAIWSNDKSGQFIYSNPPAGIINARVRDWFKESMQNKDYISDIYISAITKKPCITISLPITNQTGTVCGVIGADLNIEIA
jgi:Methyl-accepting chemotaxis protein